MSSHEDITTRFRDLHRPGAPLLMPNPWDVGSAVLLESLGFEALATTSSGFAATLGRLDGSVTREEALAHAAALVAAVDVPVSADLEDGFGPEVDDVVATIEGARAAGLAGCSIEDVANHGGPVAYERDRAVERVAAAADAAHKGGVALVLTARCDALLHGLCDLDEAIARVQDYVAAGADVVYVPALVEPDAIRRLVEATDRPVNVLALPGVPPAAELGELGVARISVGSAFSQAALGATVEAARELRERGTYGFYELAATGRGSARAAFAARAPAADR
ncbi:MAG: isocitrate lyase/phosphoenolpyruvate mutase family protein [Actinobacteria bacterium]|nr:isocitrate lyase/phosphoenolpyruvate mutase family protein [Actinomycetota bacterium]